MLRSNIFTPSRTAAPAPKRNSPPGRNTAFTHLPHWMPALLVGVIVSTLTLLAWQVLLRQQQRTIEEATQAAAVHVARELTTRMEARIHALQRMAMRWERLGPPARADWEVDVALYFQHYPGYQAIGWVDPTFTLRWVAPVAGNEAAVDMHAAAKPRRRGALEAARDRRTVQTTPVLDLAQGGKGVALYIPLFPQGGFNGVLSAVLHLQVLGDTLLEEVAPGYSVALFDGAEELYRRASPEAPSPAVGIHETEVTLPGVTWRVQVWPGSAVLARHQSMVPHALLGLGLILAGALSLTVLLARTARRQAQATTTANHQLNALNTALEQRVRERTAALEEREAQLRVLLQAARMGTWEWQCATNTVLWSPETEGLCGLTPGSFPGTYDAVLACVHPEDRDRFRQTETEARQHRQSDYEQEFRVVWPDGSPRWLLSRGHIDYDAHQQATRVQGTLIDITARKQAEIALARQLRLTQSITDNATTALFIMDQHQQCVFMNPAAEQLTGYTFAEVRGRVLHNVVHHTRPDGTPYPPVDCPIDRAFLERNQMQGEEVFVHKNGSFYPVAFTASPLREGAAITGTVIEVQDITARRQAEEARLRLAAIVTSSDDAIIGKSLDGVVTSWNAGAERLFGYRAEEMIGQSILRLLPEDRQDEEARILARLRRGESISHFETVRRTKDRRLVDVSITVSPIRDARGMIIGASKIGRDITDRKRTEAALAQYARELARAHADLRQVAYVSAHDLQEPVRQIGLYTQQIAKQYRDSMDAHMREAVAFVVEGTRRMQAQFTDLMHYLEMEEPGDGITTTDCELLFQQALAALQEPIATSSAMIAHAPLPMIKANAKHLQIVFQELVDNAIKFRGSTPPQVHVWAERERSGWRFAVRDNGLGIAPQSMPQLFGFFRKLQRRQDYPGTGMGLAICKKIVERHGGRIWLDSTPGEGSVVYFTIRDIEGRE